MELQNGLDSGAFDDGTKSARSAKARRDDQLYQQPQGSALFCRPRQAKPDKQRLNQAEQNAGPFPTKLGKVALRSKVGWGVAR